MSLRLFVGGMRGSRPSIGCGFEAFGGDTTCLLVQGPQGGRIVLDAGTGMRAVAKCLEETGPGEVTVLFSHFHLDHMAGLTMFPLFFRQDWSFLLAGPAGVREAVTGLLAHPYWPVSWDRTGSRIRFGALDDVGISDCRVRACPVPHPGGCWAYRIDAADGDGSLVFATDIEWRQRTDADEAAFLSLLAEPQPADLLIIDAHFDQAQGAAFAGWGHTSWQDGLEIARSAGIRALLLGHHAPDARDTVLRAREADVRKQMPGASLARAGQWLTIES